VKQVQTELGDIAATETSKAAYAARVESERVMRAQLSPALRQFKSYVLVTFGDGQDSVEALSDFGFTPRKVGQKTAAEKAQAAEKAKATKAKEKAQAPAPQPAPVTKA
jgi:hypothetical protein